MPLQKNWSEKTQWFVRHRAPALTLRESQHKGLPSCMSAWYMEIVKTYPWRWNMVPGSSCRPQKGTRKRACTAMSASRPPPRCLDPLFSSIGLAGVSNFQGQ
eukprot:1144357-Pelagomonas_calceolata.AAC.5